MLLSFLSRGTLRRKRSFEVAFICGMVLIVVASPARAAVTVTGDVDPSPPSPGNSLEIGQQSIGTLVINAGSTLDSSQVTIGDNGLGFATVTGAGSQWFTDNLEIGANGVGRLEVLNGGFVSTQFSSVGLGAQPQGHGTILADGLGSILLMNGSLEVGGEGWGTVRILNEAILDVATFAESTVGLRGRIELGGGLLRTGRLENLGTIIGSGNIQLLATSQPLQNQGRIESGPGDRLTFGGTNFGSPLVNSGVVAANGGEIEFFTPVNMTEMEPDSSSEITLRDGVIRFPNEPFQSNSGLSINEGTLAAIGGENDIYGRVHQEALGGGEAQTIVTNNSVLIFHDLVDIQGGDFVVHPGSTAIFLDEFQMSGALQLTVGAELDPIPLQVGAGAAFAGEVEVQLAPNYTPEVGDAFTLATGAGIDGMPTPTGMPPLPAGLVWDWNCSPTQLQLAVVAGLTGDYNGNGIVDAADYGLWRDTMESGSPELTNDPTPGTVDESDFDYWRAHFGETFDDGAGAATAAIVPEPATVVLLCMGLALTMCFRTRRPNC